MSDKQIYLYPGLPPLEPAAIPPTPDAILAEEKTEVRRWVEYLQTTACEIFQIEQVEDLKRLIVKLIRFETANMGYNHDNFTINFINEYKYRHQNTEKYLAQFTAPVINQSSLPQIDVNMSLLLPGLNHADVNQRIITFDNLLHTIFHEIQHAYQYHQISQAVSSKDCLTWGYEFLVLDAAHDWYEQNHDEFLIESNADEIGAKKLFNVRKTPHGWSKNYQAYLHGLGVDNRYQGEAVLSNGTKFPMPNLPADRLDLLAPIVDELLTQNNATEILRQFPILQKEYYFDGTKKDACELQSAMQLEHEWLGSKDDLTPLEIKQLQTNSQALYYELIYRQLASDKT